MKTKLILFFMFICFFMISCAGIYAENSSDPTERGLSYVAGAIIANAVIRAIF